MDKVQNKLAKERVAILFKHAEEATKNGELGKAKRYVGLARDIAMKTRLAMPREFKRKFCKKCHAYWLPSRTVRIRTRKEGKRLIFTCICCGAIQRHPYVKEKRK